MSQGIFPEAYNTEAPYYIFTITISVEPEIRRSHRKAEKLEFLEIDARRQERMISCLRHGLDDGVEVFISNYVSSLFHFFIPYSEHYILKTSFLFVLLGIFCRPDIAKGC